MKNYAKPVLLTLMKPVMSEIRKRAKKEGVSVLHVIREMIRRGMK